MQRRAARPVWVCWEGPNKHWDPERSQELPAPEGLTLLALAQAAEQRAAGDRNTLCCQGDASFESSRHSHFARFDGTGLGWLAPGRARLEREDFPPLAFRNSTELILWKDPGGPRLSVKPAAGPEDQTGAESPRNSRETATGAAPRRAN